MVAGIEGGMFVTAYRQEHPLPTRPARGRDSRGGSRLGGRLLDRSLGEHAGQVLLVFGRGADVTTGAEAVGGVFRRLLHRHPLRPRLLACRAANGRRTAIWGADPPAAVEPLGGGRAE